MKYKYWGCVEINTKIGSCNRWVDGRSYKTQISKLPEWVKTKMAVLDFMEDFVSLPCESHKITYGTEVDYYLYKPIEAVVSSTRESAARECNVKEE